MSVINAEESTTNTTKKLQPRGSYRPNCPQRESSEGPREGQIF